VLEDARDFGVVEHDEPGEAARSLATSRRFVLRIGSLERFEVRVIEPNAVVGNHEADNLTERFQLSFAGEARLSDISLDLDLDAALAPGGVAESVMNCVDRIDHRFEDRLQVARRRDVDVLHAADDIDAHS
jgi:hypothetical protein